MAGLWGDKQEKSPRHAPADGRSRRDDRDRPDEGRDTSTRPQRRRWRNRAEEQMREQRPPKSSRGLWK